MKYIDFQHTGISTLIKDYLQQKEELKDFYSLFASKENYLIQAGKKLKNYVHREILVKTLRQQHEEFELTEKQQQHLDNLALHNSVTVTTGHQLNIMTGPLYFIYKILHTVKICDEMNKDQNKIKFIPVFWMATEDHDFEEINHFRTYSGKYQFEGKAGGYAGEIQLSNPEKSFESFLSQLPDNIFGNELKNLVRKAYFQNNDLAFATRTLVQELLGDFGILILDANDRELKKLSVSYFKKELTESRSQQLVQQTNEKLKDYKNQAYAREINLFYLNEDKRERIERSENGFFLVDSQKMFTQEEILSELNNYPENFSPNVILRPLYQEIILPNVAYVGGGGEIAYWLQLKDVFEDFKVLFPMLVVRNSALIVPTAVRHKAEKFGLNDEKIFQPLHKFKNKFTEEHSGLFLELEDLKHKLQLNFQQLDGIAARTAETFCHMVKAQQKKQMNGFEKLYKRLLKAEKLKIDSEMKNIGDVYGYYFPEGNWQERVINFSEFYRSHGSSLFKSIYNALPAFDSHFVILYPDSEIPDSTS